MRIERRFGEYVVSEEIDPNADQVAVAKTLILVDHIGWLTSDLCPECHAPVGIVHTLDCSYAVGLPSQYDAARMEMEEALRG